MKKFIASIAIIAAIAGVSLTGAAPASASSHTCFNHTWQQGQSDGCVRLIKFMVNLSIGSALNTNDPYFDGWTGVGVMIFQGNHNLTADAIVGPNTATSMCADTRYFANNGNTDAGIVAFFYGCP